MDAAGERRRGGQAGRRVRPARQRRMGRGGPVSGRGVRASGSAARSSSAGATRARSTSSGRGAEVEHRVIPWDEVSLDEGTGIVHIAPGAGQEDFELGADPRPAGADAGRRSRPLLRRVRLAARALDGRGRRADRRLARRARLPGRGGAVRAPLPALLALRHAADLARHRRLVDRASTSCARSCSTRTRTSSGRPPTWASAWTTGCGTWATGTSRARRYYGLPLPFYPCECGHLNVVGSKAELQERATRRRSSSSRSCAAPGSTRCRSRASSAGPRCAASPRSATSGSTPASSPSRRSAGRTPSSSRRGTRPAPRRA